MKGLWCCLFHRRYWVRLFAPRWDRAYVCERCGREYPDALMDNDP